MKPLTDMCDICLKPAVIHVDEIRNGIRSYGSLCVEHLPPELRMHIPFGPHRTPAEEVAALHAMLENLDQASPDIYQMYDLRKGLKQLIKDIEAGRKRASDGWQTSFGSSLDGSTISEN